MRYPGKLTDSDIRAILLAPKGMPSIVVAAQVGCSERMVRHIRHRDSKRAIRIARELGLIPNTLPRHISPDDEQRAYVVRR